MQKFIPIQGCFKKIREIDITPLMYCVTLNNPMIKYK